MTIIAVILSKLIAIGRCCSGSDECGRMVGRSEGVVPRKWFHSPWPTGGEGSTPGPKSKCENPVFGARGAIQAPPTAFLACGSKVGTGRVLRCAARGGRPKRRFFAPHDSAARLGQYPTKQPAHGQGTQQQLSMSHIGSLWSILNRRRRDGVLVLLVVLCNLGTSLGRAWLQRAARSRSRDFDFRRRPRQFRHSRFSVD